MDIKLFDGDKELIFLDFELLTYKEDNILIFVIKNFIFEEQNNFLKQIETLRLNQIELNEQSIHLKTNKHYLFDLSSFEESHIPLHLSEGNLDLMFAFSDKNGTMIDKQYRVFKLNGLKIN